MNRAKDEMEWASGERKIGLQQPFIFSISLPKNRHDPCTLHRIGVRWEILLQGGIPVEQLNLLFKKELELIHKKYPNLRAARKRKMTISIDHMDLKNSCNYVAPKDVWATEMQYNIDSFIQELIPRINQLLAGNILSPWIVGQILTGILTTLITRYEKSRAFWLASRLVDGSIRTFKSILENGARRQKHENFFSLIFNQYQRLFILINYEISVSRKLVDYRLPLFFLMIYFSHENNEAARNDLWDCISNHDIFGEEFYAYWEKRGYSYSEIRDFEKTVFPDLEIQHQYPMSPLNQTPLFLGTPVFLSPIIILQSPPPTLLYRVEPQYSPVNLVLPPTSINYTAPMQIHPVTERELRIAHPGDKESKNTPSFHRISPQLQNFLRSNLSSNTQGLLVNPLPAPTPDLPLSITTSSTLSIRK